MGNREPYEKNRPAAAGTEDVFDSKTGERERTGHQKGPQAHAEGAHGPKTERKIVDQLESGPSGNLEKEEEQHRWDAGERPMLEGREQHDEADQNSQKNRLFEYLEENNLPKKGHDVQGGH